MGCQINIHSLQAKKTMKCVCELMPRNHEILIVSLIVETIEIFHSILELLKKLLWFSYFHNIV